MSSNGLSAGCYTRVYKDFFILFCFHLDVHLRTDEQVSNAGHKLCMNMPIHSIYMYL